MVHPASEDVDRARISHGHDAVGVRDLSGDDRVGTQPLYSASDLIAVKHLKRVLHQDQVRLLSGSDAHGIGPVEDVGQHVAAAIPEGVAHLSDIPRIAVHKQRGPPCGAKWTLS